MDNTELVLVNTASYNDLLACKYKFDFLESVNAIDESKSKKNAEKMLFDMLNVGSFEELAKQAVSNYHLEQIKKD